MSTLSAAIPTILATNNDAWAKTISLKKKHAPGRLAFSCGSAGVHELTLLDIQAGQVHARIAHKAHVQVDWHKQFPTSTLGGSFRRQTRGQHCFSYAALLYSTNFFKTPLKTLKLAACSQQIPRRRCRSHRQSRQPPPTHP